MPCIVSLTTYRVAHETDLLRLYEYFPAPELVNNFRVAVSFVFMPADNCKARSILHDNLLPLKYVQPQVTSTAFTIRESFPIFAMGLSII